MKQLFSYSILKACLLMAALLMTINAAAYDFQVDGIYYNKTSNNTVEVTYRDTDYNSYSGDIVIPGSLYYNNRNYQVTAIGNHAFYGSDAINSVIIPEFIEQIGDYAFKNCTSLRKITCLAPNPPILGEDCFDNYNTGDAFIDFNFSSDVEGVFYVTKEYCDNYINNIDWHSYFKLIVGIGNGKATPPYISISTVSQSFGDGEDYQDVTTGIDNVSIGGDGIIYVRQYESHSLFGDRFYLDSNESWSTDPSYIFNFLDYITFYHEGFEAFAIVDGYEPSDIVEDAARISVVIDEGEIIEELKSYQLEIDGIYYFWESNRDPGPYFPPCDYEIINDSLVVSFCEEFYYSTHRYSIEGGPVDVTEERHTEIKYKGDIVIPESVGQDNYRHKVTDIYYFAFGNCIELTSVTLPASINCIDEETFENCPNLAFIKCMGLTPPNASNFSFDDVIYQNTTLYVPIVAVEAYKVAEGWKNFLNIVGFFDYDFEVDGVYYAIVGDDVVVTHGENAYQGVVNIPAEVTHEGVTYDVAGISDGAFTDATVQHLILPVTIGTVGESAFAGSHIGSLVITGNGAWNAGAINCKVDNLYVMSGVTGIAGLQVNPAATVYSYSTVPPTCASGSFTGYDAALHVPASALAAYFTAPYWNYFINITSDAVEPTGLTINNDSVAVLVGNQLSLNATATPANTTPADAILWTSSNDSIATVAGGVITAVKVGECDIKAVLLDKTAVCHVSVTEIAPTSLTVSPDFAKLETGSQITLTATVLPEEATDKVVTWSSSNTAVATVNSEGIVTAVAPGECDVTATCRDIHATCHIIVVDHFIYVTLDEHNVRLLPNHMLTLTPYVTPEGTSLVVTSTNPDVAAARMANGKIQVVGIKEGTTIVKVNSTDGYAEADSCIVKVYTMRGDVNCDGFVNIGDVTSLINYLLSHNADGIDVVNADANNDGNVNISDVTRLINHILSGDELDPKDEPEEDGLTFTVNGVTFTMVDVEGGTFTMGATAEQGDDALDAERPAHQVTLSGYAIGQTEVTQSLWEAVMGNNPSRFTGRPDCPVESVSWDECQAFITQLNALTGKRFRLPTEAEWEFAARGGNKSQHYKYAGSDDLDEVAWFHDNAYGIGANGTCAVGTKKANELGIYDMSGNVWEWCQDLYDSYGSQPQTNPTGPDSGTNRTRRGGAWDQGTVSCRVSHRSNRASSYKFNNQGLRLAL